jgi:hypothetical protein
MQRATATLELLKELSQSHPRAGTHNGPAVVQELQMTG